VQRSAWFAGPGPVDTAEAPEVPELVEAGDLAGVDESAEVTEVTEVADVTEVTEAGELAADGPLTTAVVGVGDLTLPDEVASYLRDLRKSSQSDLLSATLARLHDVGWPLRPLATALGISRQAVQARIRQPLPDGVRARVPSMPPPAAVPRRRPAASSGRRPHLTVKVDQALRSAAHHKAVGEGRSLSQVIEKILDSYLRHGMPPREILLGDTTPTRPGSRRKRRARPRSSTESQPPA
jgi:hypothetical protein